MVFDKKLDMDFEFGSALQEREREIFGNIFFFLFNDKKPANCNHSHHCTA